MKTLLSFSGGLDSTYVLWKLLKTTDDEITAMNIDFRLSKVAINIQVEHCGYQEIAGRDIVSWLKRNVRDFTYIEHKAYDTLPDEENVIYFIRRAIPWLNAAKYDRICVGLQYDETGIEVMAKDPGERRGVDRRKVMNNIFSEAKRGELWIPMETWREAKPHAVASLPKDLLDMVVTCVNPSIGQNGNITDCGSCFRCLYVEKIQHMLGNGMTPDNVLDWRINEGIKTGVWRGIRQVINGNLDPITIRYFDSQFKNERTWDV